jgi:hypothetical protein
MRPPDPRPARTPLALTRAQARRVWALFAGVLALAVGASFAVVLPPAAPELTRILLVVAAVLTPLELATSFVAPAVIRRRAARAATPPSPDGLAATQTIVGTAQPLGAALFACLCHVVTREPLFLAFAAASFLAMAAWYPSPARWARLGRRGDAPPARLAG